jgi:hypothetical protein
MADQHSILLQSVLKEHQKALAFTQRPDPISFSLLLTVQLCPLQQVFIDHRTHHEKSQVENIKIQPGKHPTLQIVQNRDFANLSIFSVEHWD